MNKLFTFFKESFQEMTTQVTWPKYSELQSNTTLVLVASIIFALLIGSIDSVIDVTMNWFYSSF